MKRYERKNLLHGPDVLNCVARTSRAHCLGETVLIDQGSNLTLIMPEEKSVLPCDKPETTHELVPTVLQ